MTQIEALKLALDALEEISTLYMSLPKKGCMALAAIGEVLAGQTAQRCQLCNYQHGHAIGCKNNPVDIALANMAKQPAQPEHELCPSCRNGDIYACTCTFKSDHRMMENAQGDLERINLVQTGVGIGQPAHQQEPVAWMWRCKPYCDWPEWSVSLKRPADSGRDGHKRTEGYEDVPLYTSPPPRKQWVGLTDEERDDCKVISIEQTCLAIEAKLKEKNT